MDGTTSVFVSERDMRAEQVRRARVLDRHRHTGWRAMGYGGNVQMTPRGHDQFRMITAFLPPDEAEALALELLDAAREARAQASARDAA